MSKLCFLFTQTSSIQEDYNIPYNNYEKWTRLIRLNYVIYNEFLDGFNFQKNFLVRPQGFEIDLQTEKFTSITNELAIDKGQSISEILKEFILEIESVDFFVGHNIDFHLNVIRSEVLRNGFQESHKGYLSKNH